MFIYIVNKYAKGKARYMIGDDAVNFSDLNNVISILVLVITWLIVQPLKSSITALQVSVEKLGNVVEQLRKDVGENNEETVRVGEVAKSAHKRIDRIDARLAQVEGRCVHCHMQHGGEE